VPSWKLLLLCSESNSGEIQGFIFLKIVSSPCVNQIGSPNESNIVRSSRNITQNSRDYTRRSIFWGDTCSRKNREIDSYDLKERRGDGNRGLLRS